MTVVEPIKSQHDKKLYRYVQLKNGLSVLLISDPDINKDVQSEVINEDGDTDGNTGSVKRSSNHLHVSVVPQKRRQLEDEEDQKMSDDHGDEAEGEEEESDQDEGDEDEEDESGEGEDEEDEDFEGSTAGKKKHKAQKKAAAAMSVGVGSFCDPPHMQGLSHYLEHMLFMGSKKYPSENEYDDYITKNAGSSNAFTELESTNYHFEVAPNALPGALDRFAQFFLSPLCLEGSLEREVLAVDSEFSGVLQVDGCRVSQLICHTAEEGHIYRSFSWGNKKSLWDEPREAGINIRDQIFQHYNQHYSAERMSLVVLGGDPLDDLQGLCEETFKELPFGKGPRPEFSDAGMPFKGRHLYIMPAVKDHHDLSITFPLPCLYNHYEKKPEQYISHLVGHEGPGSLLSALKALGWATEVVAGVEEDGHSQNTACFLFGITLTLTDAGLDAGPGMGLAAVALVFQYLHMLRKEGPQEWVYSELKSIYDMKFRFQEEEEAMEYVTQLAQTMHLVKPEHVLCSDFLIEHWDPALVAELMNEMKPEGCSYRIDLLTKSYNKVKEQLSALASSSSSSARSVVEPWFQLESVCMEIPPSMSAGWSVQDVSPQLHLPPPNPYLPTDFTLRASADDHNLEVETNTKLASTLGLPVVLAAPPTLVLEEPGLRVWHKLDSTFKTPRTFTAFRLSSPAWLKDARSTAAAKLFLKLMEDALNEDAYLADVAGLHYGLTGDDLAGLEIKVEGFSHKLPVLVTRIFTCLASGQFEEAAFNREKEALERQLRNTNMQVMSHANYNRVLALRSKANHVSAILKETELLTLNDIVVLQSELMKTCHVEALAHGNLTSEQAVQLCKSACMSLGPGCSASPSIRIRDQCVSLPYGVEVAFREDAKNSEEENAGIEVYLQCCSGDKYADRAAVDLLDQILSEPAYNQLRTQEQLGYTVYSGMRLTHGVLGFCFGVVSAKKHSEALEERIEAFILSCAEEKIPKLSEEDFQVHKASLQATKLQRDRSLHDEALRHWDNVWNQRYDFLTRENELKALDAASLADIKDWFQKYIAPGATHRRKLAVHVQPTKAGCKAASPAGASEAMVCAPKSSRSQEKSSVKEKKKGGTKPSKGKPSAVDAHEEPSVPSKRVLISDVLVWRIKQQVYPITDGPEPISSTLQ
ncbi:hypothetical protein CEUSTIGMA_g3702.t1 [Chlamydomonas eustigma]|uniref:Peptidase M16 N-terminal domain-containing protein n=1 Tax=Chlamydomonas eustigma TaxID=1157962 RepID=A0A250WZJ2_9CHLO|nr:hypothetical protein CEUSTIGMA_g3702.t1 [Chlamydomonas eustigma]|eukprot:GAX76258.1 hypothetical protein CEUSTIGMA_g3702.t1 [Chlamydomonas eustigma]